MNTSETPRNDPPVPFFISLSGKKQVGKDTSAEIVRKLLETKGLRIEVTAFAYALKHIAITCLGIDTDLVYGTDADKETLTHVRWDTLPDSIRFKYAEPGSPWARTGPMTVREVLQILGTDIFREMFDSDLWAKYPFRQTYDADVVLLTDCRFPNEKRLTEESGGVIIRLERTTGLKDNHASETALDNEDFGYVYRNDGTLEQLETFLRMVLKQEKLI